MTEQSQSTSGAPVGLREALEQMQGAAQGFQRAIHEATGLPHPWPALELAYDNAQTALAAQSTPLAEGARFCSDEENAAWLDGWEKRGLREQEIAANFAARAIKPPAPEQPAAPTGFFAGPGESFGSYLKRATDSIAEQPLPSPRAFLEHSFVESAEQPAIPTEQTMQWRHVKTGGLYEIIAHADLETNEQTMVVYQSKASGKTWVRPASEFYDGRFVREGAEQPAALQQSAEPCFEDGQEPATIKTMFPDFIIESDKPARHISEQFAAPAEQSIERAAVTNAAEEVRRFLCADCKGDPPRMSMAGLLALAEAVLAQPPATEPAKLSEARRYVVRCLDAVSMQDTKGLQAIERVLREIDDALTAAGVRP